ncbi:MAG: flotillin-like protein FloA [Planctomycetaceae bacterium]|nr:flotillin-like protein FloA [Planctomycetaceae bacterium]
MDTIAIVIGVGFLIFLCMILAGIVIYFFPLWIQSKLTGAGIGFADLIGMTLRKVRPGIIVQSKIMAVQSGLPDPEITAKNLEAHYLAGGNVPQVIRALIAANKAKTIQLSYREATAIDLAGRDVLEAVQTSVYPRVIDCPPQNRGRSTLDAMAKDGIQLKVTARVTVRSNLQQLIGGATEETIMARVGEGIVSAIGSAASHKAVLENPDVISKTVLSRRLDAETAFEIVSIDIADIDVGQNIGARLRADQAEADTQVARARSESRRAEAVATEQENKAEIERSRAKLVEAESQVPLSVAESLESGTLGILDLYKLRNIQADTEMRKGIAKSSGQAN